MEGEGGEAGGLLYNTVMNAQGRSGGQRARGSTGRVAVREKGWVITAAPYSVYITGSIDSSCWSAFFFAGRVFCIKGPRATFIHVAWASCQVASWGRHAGRRKASWLGRRVGLLGGLLQGGGARGRGLLPSCCAAACRCIGRRYGARWGSKACLQAARNCPVLHPHLPALPPAVGAPTSTGAVSAAGRGLSRKQRPEMGRCMGGVPNGTAPTAPAEA